MAHIYPKVFFGNRLVSKSSARLSVASSAVLYGLSVYTVFLVVRKEDESHAFRLEDHWRRLLDSARIVGFDGFEDKWDFGRFRRIVSRLIEANKPKGDVFVRVSVHLDAELAGPRIKRLPVTVSMFVYDAVPILPAGGARLKTSVWRRVSDAAIPARAKINGAYVNSALAKQEALDSGFDDCVMLDNSGHVTELSAANIFLVRNGELLTPSAGADTLEGINRRTIIELAKEAGINVTERQVDLTELYVADEVFACGTSAYLTPVNEIDGRKIGKGQAGEVTRKLRQLHRQCIQGRRPEWSLVL